MPRSRASRVGAFLGGAALALSCRAPSSGSAVGGRDLRSAVGARDLHVECGRVEEQAEGVLRLRSACLRAVVGDRPHAGAVLSFAYHGPSESDEPLASGELRRQIGLKLRARDTCNVVYVMWHVAPTNGIHVSVKSNPALRTHAECGDGGYINLQPARQVAVAAIRPDERHTLEARVVGDELRVAADGMAAWEGRLPAEAFAFDGPVGIRSDNGEFDIELKVAAP